MDEKPYIPPYRYTYTSRGSYDKAVLSEADYIKLMDDYPCFARRMDDIDADNRVVTWHCDALYGPYDCVKCRFRKEKRDGKSL